MTRRFLHTSVTCLGLALGLTGLTGPTLGQVAEEAAENAAAEDADPLAPLMAAHAEARVALLAGLADERAKLVRTLSYPADGEDPARVAALDAHDVRRRRAGLRRIRADFDAAARLGLQWLAVHQSPEGYWSSEGFADSCAGHGGARCDGTGRPHQDVGVTVLALLCFVRSGPRDEWPPGVELGLGLLERWQHEDGYLAGFRGSDSTYHHALGTAVLLEAVLAGREDLRPAAERAVAKLLDLRNPGSAWRYDDPAMVAMLENPNDSSMTSWALQALALAQRAGMDVPPEAVRDGLAFLDEVTDESGRTGYIEPGGWSSRHEGLHAVWPGDSTEACTAAAMLARHVHAPAPEGPQARRRQEPPMGHAVLDARRPRWRPASDPAHIDLYYWSLGARVMSGLGDEGLDWLGALHDTLAVRGVPEGEGATGSWNPRVGPWGADGGRVYATAVMTLGLLEAARAE